MAKTLKDLVLALLNATLILVALCLFLAWKVSSTVDGMVGTFAQNLEIVGPLREDVQSMTSELGALRSDLAQIGSQTGEARSAAMARLQTRVDQMDTRLADARANLASLRNAPEQLIDQALEKTAQNFTQSVIDIRNCTPPAPADLTSGS